MIPASASLLTPRDTPRNQGQGNRLCGFFGARKALEIMLDRTELPDRRVSISYLRDIGQKVQGVTGDIGVTPWSMARALDLYGVCLQRDNDDGNNAWVTPPATAFNAAIKPIRMIPMPYLPDDTTGLASPRYWIARGYPLYAHINIHSCYSSLSGPVESHEWDTTGPVLDEHLTCFAEYTPDRIIAADSGAGWYGDDRGRVGFPNAKFAHGPQRCVNTLWMIVQGPAIPQPVEGYMPDLAKPTLAEMGPVVMLKRAELKAAEEVATQQFRAEWSERLYKHHKPTDTGWQWVIDALVAENASARIGDVIAGQGEGWLLGMAKTLGLDVSKLRTVD